MRRRYAFEAEGLSEEVKSQLEKVEDVVDEKCKTPEDCNKILDKIGAEEEKFNSALKDMADAAKDCKDGKCDKAEMAAKISPKMAELKEVAKNIGVATEGDALCEKELQDAKKYLEGAKEIVESKLDEVGGEEPKAEDKKDGEPEEKPAEEPKAEDDEEEIPADESFFADIRALEGYTMTDLASCETAIECAMFDCEVAMEGYNWDKRKEYNAKMKETKAKVKAAKQAAKAGDAAGAKKSMDEVIADLEAFKKAFVEECEQNQTALDAICGYFAYGWRALGLELLTLVPTLGVGTYAVAIKHNIEFWVDLIQVFTKKSDVKAADFNMYTKSMEHNMGLIIGQYKKVAAKINAKALANAEKKGDPEEKAEESALSFDGFIAACESAMIAGKAEEPAAPYLFA